MILEGGLGMAAPLPSEQWGGDYKKPRIHIFLEDLFYLEIRKRIC